MQNILNDVCVCDVTGARVPAVIIKLRVERKETYRPKGGMICMNIADKCVPFLLNQPFSILIFI